MCFLAFSHQYQHNFSSQSHRLLFSHASAEVRGENTPERKGASTRDQAHNHEVMSPTCSPLSQPRGVTLIYISVGDHLSDFTSRQSINTVAVVMSYS